MSQNTGLPHGGYIYQNIAVGTRRTTDSTACAVASIAALFKHAGVACSTEVLNRYLQEHKGYMPAAVALVTGVTVTGDTLYYDGMAANTELLPGDTFVIERGPKRHQEPIATYRVLPGTPRRARRIERYDFVANPRVHDIGYVYWNTIAEKAERYAQTATGQGIFHLRTVSAATVGSSLPAIAESLLARGLPVAVHTHGHWVVADGWEPAFGTGPIAVGTYTIRDPLNRRNYRRLIRGHYGNEFKMIRYLEPVGSATASATESRRSGLEITARGASDVTITDDQGRTIARDASTGMYVSTIPGAWVVDDVTADHDANDDFDADPVEHAFHLEDATGGYYVVRVQAAGVSAVSATALDSSGVLAFDAVVDSAVGVTGSSYEVAYAPGDTSVSVRKVGTVSASRTIARHELRVVSRPFEDPIRFSWVGSRRADMLDMFDVLGRRIDSVDVPASEGGVQVIEWRWGRVGSKPGVYLARMRSGAAGTVRVVVLN